MYSCSECVEDIMDDILNEQNHMPILRQLNDIRLCNVCAQEAKYEVIKSDVKGEWE